ncbi:hypothetical protein MBLNU459_g6030t3 [Dothideomycetes sp. NU459]
MCGQFEGALTDSGTYLYGTNQWGWDSSGAQCMEANLDDSKTHAASFNATWSWEARDVWVHSYPNVGYESAQLPTQLSNIKSFVLDGEWAMYPSDSAVATTNDTALNALGVKADIALDMFIDINNVTSMNASAALLEVLVWQSVWGGVAPIGYDAPPTNISYNLSGNQQGQKQLVYSWVPSVNQNSINADVAPLISYLYDLGNITSDMYLGLVQFGSETVHATQNITFNVKSASMSLDVISARATSTSSSKGAAANVARPTNFVLPAVLGAAAVLVL